MKSDLKRQNVLDMSISGVSASISDNSRIVSKRLNMQRVNTDDMSAVSVSPSNIAINARKMSEVTKLRNNSANDVRIMGVNPAMQSTANLYQI